MILILLTACLAGITGVAISIRITGEAKMSWSAYGIMLFSAIMLSTLLINQETQMQHENSLIENIFDNIL